MRRLTLNDQVTLRGMLSNACQWQDLTNASYQEAAEICEQYEQVLKKIVPIGPIKGLRANDAS